MAPAGDLVGRVAEQGVGQGRLARAVGAHEGVELALADDQVDPAQDLGAVDGHVQVLDLEKRGHGRSLSSRRDFHYGHSEQSRPGSAPDAASRIPRTAPTR